MTKGMHFSGFINKCFAPTVTAITSRFGNKQIQANEKSNIFVYFVIYPHNFAFTLSAAFV